MSRYAMQLHTLRDRPEPLPGLLREVARAGFDGVEFADRLRRADARQVRAALDGTELEPVAAHVDFEWLRRDREAILARCADIDCDRIVIPHLPIERFRTRGALRELFEELDRIATVLAGTEIELLIHTTRELLLPFFTRWGVDHVMRREGMPRGVYNHLAWAATTGVERDRAALDRSPLGMIATNVPEVGIEIDAKSVATAGFDLDLVLETLADRVDLVHLSDVRRSRFLPPDYRPVRPGQGLVDLDRFASATNDTDWIIVEHDDPDDPERILEELADVSGASTGAKPPRNALATAR